MPWGVHGAFWGYEIMDTGFFETKEIMKHVLLGAPCYMGGKVLYSTLKAHYPNILQQQSKLRKVSSYQNMINFEKKEIV